MGDTVYYNYTDIIDDPPETDDLCVLQGSIRVFVVAGIQAAFYKAFCWSPLHLLF